MTFIIIHFNTPELTACLCASFRKYHSNDKLLIFDNSDKRPFTYSELFDAKYIDNTKGQLINFEKEFSKYNIDDKVWKINKLGSAKHTFTIDWILKNIDDDGICLLDSDILIKKKIDFCDSKYITAGELNKKEIKTRNRPPRILPYIQYINIKQIRELKISFFDYTKIMGFKIEARPYDTGCSFLEDIQSNTQKPNVKDDLNLNEYMVHFKGGSWAKTEFKEWLLQNKELWQVL